MSTKRYQVSVNGLPVEVIRKNIKNLHLRVYPPEGHVRIAVPLLVSDDAVRVAVASRLAWIKRQQERFQNQARQLAPEYIFGESHYLFGQRFLLNVLYHKGAGRLVQRNNSWLDLYVREGSSLEQRERVFQEWYRKQLRELIPSLIEKWEGPLCVHVAEWGVKRMKTRWGSCNIKARRIWLNLELAKKPLCCLEYVVVHEMVHLLESKHNARFIAYMDKFLPEWRSIREELNRLP